MMLLCLIVVVMVMGVRIPVAMVMRIDRSPADPLVSQGSDPSIAHGW